MVSQFAPRALFNFKLKLRGPGPAGPEQDQLAQRAAALHCRSHSSSSSGGSGARGPGPGHSPYLAESFASRYRFAHGLASAVQSCQWPGAASLRLALYYY